MPKSYNYSPMTDIQVIVPTRVGAVGANTLKTRACRRCSIPPPPKRMSLKTTAAGFRVGDKVMQIKNNYDILWQRDNGEEGLGVYNGDNRFYRVDRPPRQDAAHPL